MSYNGKVEHWRRENSDFIGRYYREIERDDFGIPLDYDDAEKPLTQIFEEL